MKREYKGFRLANGTIDNSNCPHLHTVQDGADICCQTCGKVIVRAHISGGVYSAIETAYGRTVDHGFNIKIF